MIEIIKAKSSREALEKASVYLNKILDAHSHLPILFLSSGGSALKLLEHIVIFPSNFTVGMTDERFTQNLKENNFAQLVETSFFEKAQDCKTHFIDTKVQPGEDLELFTKRFETSLVNWKKEYPGGRIVITQGMGVDGHTVGIMPYPEKKGIFQEFFESNALVRGYDAKEKNKYPLRATITLPFLRQIDHSIMYISGKEKKDALSLMLSAKGTLFETPARIIHEMKEVHIFTDISCKKEA